VAFDKHSLDKYFEKSYMDLLIKIRYLLLRKYMSTFEKYVLKVGLALENPKIFNSRRGSFLSMK